MTSSYPRPRDWKATRWGPSHLPPLLWPQWAAGSWALGHGISGLPHFQGSNASREHLISDLSAWVTPLRPLCPFWSSGSRRKRWLEGWPQWLSVLAALAEADLQHPQPVAQLSLPLQGSNTLLASTGTLKHTVYRTRTNTERNKIKRCWVRPKGKSGYCSQKRRMKDREMRTAYLGKTCVS